MDYINSKQNELKRIEEEAKTIIPDLIKLQKSNLEKQETKIYTGIEGWKTLYMEIFTIEACGKT